MGQVLFEPPNVAGAKNNAYWLNSTAMWARANSTRNLTWHAHEAGFMMETTARTPLNQYVMSSAAAVDFALAKFGRDPAVATGSPWVKSVLVNWLNGQRATEAAPTYQWRDWAAINLTTMTMLSPDLPLARLSRPATLPGGMDRRRFLQLMGAGAGAAAVASPLLSALEAYAAPPVAANEGILVLIMMEGGNDGLNTVVPTGESRYYQLRPGLAIPAASALPIASGIGLHPSFTKLKARFDQGDVAVVQGVGYANPDLSHFSSMGIWMNGWAGGAQHGGATGWNGRFLDGLPNAAAESLYGAVI